MKGVAVRRQQHQACSVPVRPDSPSASVLSSTLAADIPCVAHGLNNFVKDLSGLPLFKEVFDGCHTMIKTILEHKDLRAK